MEPVLPSPEALADEILSQALGLTDSLRSLLEGRNQLRPETLQDALISFTQILLIGFINSFAKLYPDLELLEYENEAFLFLAKDTLEELLQRKPTDQEFEYFLTFYRSHFEMLKKEISETETMPEENEEIFLELKKRLDELFRRLLQEGEIRH